MKRSFIAVLCCLVIGAVYSLLQGCASEERLVPITKEQTDALRAAAAPGDEIARQKAYSGH